MYSRPTRVRSTTGRKQQQAFCSFFRDAVPYQGTKGNDAEDDTDHRHSEWHFSADFRTFRLQISFLVRHHYAQQSNRRSQTLRATHISTSIPLPCVIIEQNLVKISAVMFVLFYCHLRIRTVHHGAIMWTHDVIQKTGRTKRIAIPPEGWATAAGNTQKFGEVRPCGFRVMRVDDRQTDILITMRVHCIICGYAVDHFYRATLC